VTTSRFVNNGGVTKRGQAPALTREERSACYAVARQSTFPLRNLVILRCSFECSMRAIEIGELRWWMVYDKLWQLRSWMDLHADATKGGYGGRKLPVRPGGLGLALERLRTTIEPDDRERFVCTFKKHATDRDVRSASVQRILRETFDAAGVPDASSHSGRRTGINEMYDRGGLKEAQLFAGHRSPATTMRYVLGKQKLIEQVVDEYLVIEEPARVLHAVRPRMAKAGLDSRRANVPMFRSKARGIA